MGGNSSSQPQPIQNTQALKQARIRIKNELEAIQNNPPARWRVIVQNDLQWSIWITAENRSPFRKVPFEVRVKFPQNYPLSWAMFQLVNFHRFFHPNISKYDGHVCQESVFNVRPAARKIRDLVDGFVILLSNPNPDSPLNGQAAAMIKSDEKNNTHEYFKKALLIFRGIKN